MKTRLVTNGLHRRLVQRYSHREVVSLSTEGRLILGIRDDLAEKISANKAFWLAGTPAAAAFLLWKWIAIGIFFLSVYWSFTQDWWWFIIGFGVARGLQKANTKGNSANLIDHALVDPGFYNTVMVLDGWEYRISEELFALHQQTLVDEWNRSVDEELSSQ